MFLKQIPSLKNISPFILIWISFSISMAVASPKVLTYQGRIINADSIPLEHSSVSFIFQITNPSDTCVIYQESIANYNMTGSHGLFDLAIGSGTVSWPNTTGFKVMDSFDNATSYDCGTCTGYTCSATTSTYTPSLQDIRNLRVQFHDGNIWRKISPVTAINAVPFAGYASSAQKLGAHVSDDFLLKGDINSGTTCGGGNFLTWNATTKTFGCDTPTSGGGSSAGITSLNGLTNTSQSFGSIGTTGTSPLWTSAGGVHFLNIPLASSSGVTAGLISKSDFDNFSAKQSSLGFTPLNPTNNLNDVSDPSASRTNLGLGTAALKNTPSTGDAALSEVVLGTDSRLTNSRTPGGNASGDLSGTYPSPSVTKINGYNLNFSAAPSANQYLKFDGTNWISSDLPNGGTVTSISTGVGLVGGPISSSGTIALDASGVAPGTYGTSGKVARLSVDTYGRIISVSETDITAVSPVDSSLANGNIWIGNTSSKAAPVPITGDVSLANSGETKVIALQNKSVSATLPTSEGQVLRYNGTAWTPNFVSMADLRSTITGASAFLSSCGADQSMQWSSTIDSLSCTNISLPAARIFGTAGYVPYFNGSGILSSSMVFQDGNNMGVGTSTPAVKMDVAGEIRPGNSSVTCTTTIEGSQRYNSTLKRMEFCDGVTWQDLSGPHVGAVSAFLQSLCPAGWIAADGAEISRATYGNLFAAISTSFGAGDGSTTFRLPDFRGYFLRGWSNGSAQDPDAAIRTDRGDGTVGDQVGTKQDGAAVVSLKISTATGVSQLPTEGAYLSGGSASTTKIFVTSPGTTVTLGGNSATETRPKNINVLYCIKY